MVPAYQTNTYMALTADFRYVLGEILIKHIGVKDLATVFPGFDNSSRRFPGPFSASLI